MKFIKKIGFLVLAILIAVILYGVYGVFINPKSPKGNVLFKNENIEMEVSYSRPYKRERLIFGNVNEGALVPFGKYWRLGANFATSFKVNKDVSFSGRPLKAGEYRVYAVPFEKNWKLTLNSEFSAFGFNEPDYSKDILSVNLHVINTTEELEQFTIDFIDKDSDVHLRIRWDNTKILVPISY
jgi:hypothetical protein